MSMIEFIYIYTNNTEITDSVSVREDVIIPFEHLKYKDVKEEVREPRIGDLNNYIT